MHLTPFIFFVILYPDLILPSCSGGCTLQQLSVMLTQFKLFDKLDPSNFPISLWKQKGNSCFLLTTIQLNEKKSRSLSPIEWKILLIIFWKVIFDILKTFCHNNLLIISGLPCQNFNWHMFFFNFTLMTSWSVKEFASWYAISFCHIVTGSYTLTVLILPYSRLVECC